LLDIGFFELLVIAIIGLLVVGPERLPKYIAQGMKMLRNIKDMATKAKDDIVESAGIKDLDLKDLSKFDPNKLANNVFDDKEETKPQAQKKFDQDAT
jgi:sec-independent protein translocase protein TatB